MNEEQRGSWYLLTGLLIGLALGLLYTWVISPVQFTDTAPSSLRSEFKDAYRSLIAQAYLADNDIGRARSRLDLLKDSRPSYELGAQAQRILAQGGSQAEARALAQLSTDLERQPITPTTSNPAGSAGTATPAGTQTPAVVPSATLDESQMVSTPTPAPTATATPFVTFTPRAAMIDQPKLSGPLSLKDRKTFCSTDLPEGLLQVEVKDKDQQSVAGVRVDVTWNGGQDTFYTGLYPEIDSGYADFTMAPNITYSLRAGDGGQTVSDLSPGQCTDKSGKSYLGGVKLVLGN